MDTYKIKTWPPLKGNPEMSTVEAPAEQNGQLKVFSSLVISMADLPLPLLSVAITTPLAIVFVIGMSKAITQDHSATLPFLAGSLPILVPTYLAWRFLLNWVFKLITLRRLEPPFVMINRSPVRLGDEIMIQYRHSFGSSHKAGSGGQVQYRLICSNSQVARYRVVSAPWSSIIWESETVVCPIRTSDREMRFTRSFALPEDLPASGDLPDDPDYVYQKIIWYLQVREDIGSGYMYVYEFIFDVKPLEEA